MIKKIIIELKNSFFLNKNEQYFIDKSNSIKSFKNNKTIFLGIQMDYAHLTQATFLLQSKKFKDHKIIGIWNYNISPSWKNKYYLIEMMVMIKNKLKIFLLKKKWIKIYKAIGVGQIIDTNDTTFFNDYKYKIKSNSWISKIKNIEKNKFIKLKIENIEAGDLIIDTYIRFRNIQTLQYEDQFLKVIIKKFMISKNNIEKAIRKFKPKYFLLSYSNYSAGVVARTALYNNIDVFCTGDTMSYLKKLSKNDTNTHTSYRNFKVLFKTLNAKNTKLQQSRIELKKRFLGIKDKAYSYMKKSPYKKNSKKFSSKADGVLFLHDFMDTPHHFKSMFFLDFYDWAVYSLKIIQKYNLNIAIKPHPNAIHQNSIIIENLKKQFPNIKWIGKNISNTDIFKSGIKFGISVYGSILYELAYNNIVAIAATSYHPSYNYNFVHTPKNKNEYKKLLINSKKLKFKNDINKKIEEFYYMWTFFNHDALPETGRLINLRDLNFSNSKSLVQFSKKLSRYNN